MLLICNKIDRIKKREVSIEKFFIIVLVCNQITVSCSSSFVLMQI